MPEFRQPVDFPEDASYYESKNIPEVLAKLARNYNELVRDYNELQANLDEEIFYRTIPRAAGSDAETVIVIGTFTPSHKVKVTLPDANGIATNYYIQLDEV